MRTTDKQLRGDEDQPDLNQMRYDLAEREMEGFLDNPSDLIELLVHGCEGLIDLPEIDIREQYSEIFGKES